MEIDLTPSRLLVQATRFIPKYDSALDLGAGQCADSQFLLDLGFNNVVAVDTVKPKFGPLDTRFQFLCGDIESIQYADYDLVNAQFVLQHVKHPWALIDNIRNALSDGGVFVGQFFHVDDPWVNDRWKGYTEDEVRQLLSDFKEVRIEKVSYGDKTMGGDYKVWTVVEFVVEK